MIEIQEKEDTNSMCLLLFIDDEQTGTDESATTVDEGLIGELNDTDMIPEEVFLFVIRLL
jgi:hypothetical protein